MQPIKNEHSAHAPMLTRPDMSYQGALQLSFMNRSITGAEFEAFIRARDERHTCSWNVNGLDQRTGWENASRESKAATTVELTPGREDLL